MAQSEKKQYQRPECIYTNPQCTSNAYKCACLLITLVSENTNKCWRIIRLVHTWSVRVKCSLTPSVPVCQGRLVRQSPLLSSLISPSPFVMLGCQFPVFWLTAICLSWVWESDLGASGVVWCYATFSGLLNHLPVILDHNKHVFLVVGFMFTVVTWSL